MCHLSESGFSGLKDWQGIGNEEARESESVGVGSPNPSGGGTPPLRLGLFFAPEERHVYRRAICPKPCAPEEHHVPFV